MRYKYFNQIVLVLVVSTIVAQQAFALAFMLGDAGKGKDEHDLRCTSCHDSMFDGDGSKIYSRDDHKIKTVEGLIQQVQFCNKNTQNGALSDEEVDDIAVYLNESYYLFED